MEASLGMQIRAHLNLQSAPVTAREIAVNVASVDDLVEVQNLLRMGVMNGKVIRHHCPDGLLRYSAADKDLAPAPAATPESAPASVEPEARRPHQGGKGKPPQKRPMLLELLGNRRMTASQLKAASAGLFSMKQVQNLLQQARLHDEVVYWDGMWQRTDMDVSLDEAAAANPDSAELPARTGRPHTIVITTTDGPTYWALMNLLRAVEKINEAFFIEGRCVS